MDHAGEDPRVDPPRAHREGLRDRPRLRGANFGERAFSLRIPGAPTGGPVGRNRVIWNDEFLATEIGQVGTQFDGLGHIGVAVKGEDKAEMRFYNGFPASNVNSTYGLKKLGIENVKPILTRGLLLDIVAVRGRNLNLGEEITVSDIEQALQRQGIAAADAIKPGPPVASSAGSLGFSTSYSPEEGLRRRETAAGAGD